MDALGDVRIVAMPAVLCASLLQYLHFAKKPMAAPCHRVSDKGARKLIFVGLALELGSLIFLPVSSLYPMNASCLVLVYFFKEAKHIGGVSIGSTIPMAAALSVWALPMLDAAGGEMPKVVPVGRIVQTVLDPDSCVYIVSLLLFSVIIHGMASLLGDSVLVNCIPPALNFGVSAVMLKALAQVLWIIFAAPLQLESWAALMALTVLLLGVRSAAASPLRRAMEMHDNLSVLTNYGAVSSAAAMFTGYYVFDELKSLSLEEKLLFLAIAAVHCWGLRTLGRPGRGQKSAKKDDDANVETPSKPGSRRSGGSVQMTDMSGSPGSQSEQPAGPLLNFNEPRTIDQDAQIEEQLFARALAPQRLASVTAGLPPVATPSSTDEVFVGGFGDPSSAVVGQGHNPFDVGPGETPQFDADFEEIMRRFDEDDKQNEEAGPGVLPIIDLSPEVPAGNELAGVKAAPPQAGPAPVLQFDAHTLLDDSMGCGNDEEDDLLRSIEDIDGADI